MADDDEERHGTRPMVALIVGLVGLLAMALLIYFGMGGQHG
ncbi:MAG: hypothetical protein WB495_02325 [Xanthobacteraceae bacterium]|jgi:hypothetical protein